MKIECHSLKKMPQTLTSSPTPTPCMDPWVHPTPTPMHGPLGLTLLWYLCCKYECFLTNGCQDILGKYSVFYRCVPVIFFAIKPTPVLGVIPNGKKYLFFPNAWFKIPNLRKIPSQAHICNQNLYMYCQKLQLVNQSDTYENE